MSSDETSKTSCLIGGLVFGIAIGIVLSTYIQKEQGQELDQWDKNDAIQYEIATQDGGKWGEIIHQYEGFECEAHRWRYRGAYYIGQVGFDCGDLILEPKLK